MIYKTISSKAVIQKIYRDLKPTDASWTTDAVEWIGEALDFIGYHAGFEKKVIDLTVSDFKAPIPSDLYHILTVEYSGIPLSYGVAKTAYDKEIRLNEALRDYYVINPNYIITSFEKGDIKVHYDAYMLDEEGFPLVPDNIYYKQALEWYVIRQMLLGGYTNPNFNWQIADQMWQRYCQSAQNDAMFPSIDKMESFRETWVRLIPNIDFHEQF